MGGSSGAELKAVCTEAGMFALRERRVHVTQVRCFVVGRGWRGALFVRGGGGLGAVVGFSHLIFSSRHPLRLTAAAA